MKKEGFSLVELFGVIVILVLIMLLAFSIGNNIFKTSKNNLEYENLKLIYSSADRYINEHIDNYPRVEGRKYCINLSTLVNEGLLPENLQSYINNEGIPLTRTVEIKVNSKRKYEYKFDAEKNICVS